MRWKALAVTLFLILGLAVVHSTYYNGDINSGNSELNISEMIDVLLETVPEPDEDECYFRPQNESTCYDDHWDNQTDILGW